MSGSINPTGKLKGKLYLMPVTLADTDPLSVLPVSNIDLLSSIRYYIVENVRSARRFIKKCCPSIDINSLTFSVLDEHTDPKEISSIIEPLLQGCDMAILSEAGCPAVADPGSLAVAEAQKRDISVHPLVGPSSIILSLMASGFNGQKFAFNGYLPVDKSQRQQSIKEMLRKIHKEHQTQIFIETPYRNNKLIRELCEILPGDTMLCVASNLTAENEKVLTMVLRRWQKFSFNYDKIPAIFLLFSH